MDTKRDILEKLEKSILSFDVDSANIWAKEAIKQIDPILAADVVTNAIRKVGEDFSLGEIFLPELIGAGSATTAAMSVIRSELKKKSISYGNLATLVIGTVKGDIHDIGKNIVATMFQTSGFEVFDIGVDVSAEKFLEAVKKYHPDILGMSSLLTTTAPELKRTISLLEKTGVRNELKLIVGGAAVTEDFSNQIGADCYGANAAEAVEVAKTILNLK